MICVLYTQKFDWLTYFVLLIYTYRWDKKVWKVCDLQYHLVCGWLWMLQSVTMHTLSRTNSSILQLTWLLIVVGVYKIYSSNIEFPIIREVYRSLESTHNQVEQTFQEQIKDACLSMRQKVKSLILPRQQKGMGSGKRGRVHGQTQQNGSKDDLQSKVKNAWSKKQL